MNTRADLVAAVGALAAPHVSGRRSLDPSVALPFRATMRNDFMTPRGTPYKWQELRADVVRTVRPANLPTLANAHYSWQDVAVRTGPANRAPAEVAWTPWSFAKGQGFNFDLLHSDVTAAASDSDADGWCDGPSWGAAGMLYPDLPKSPAVDLLLMITWDVQLFEVLCTHLGTEAALAAPGVETDLERYSGSGGDLHFSNPDAASFFRNTQMRATKLGYCVHGDRPAAVYSFECLDCELQTMFGATVQKGRSSYWGTVHVDLQTGDLLEGRFTEVITGIVTDGSRREVPFHRRRLVRIGLTDRVPSTAAAPAGVASTASSLAARVPPTATVDAQPTRGPEAAAMAALGRRADRVRTRVAEQLTALRDLPPELRPLAEAGFRTLVGTGYDEALIRLDALRDDLTAWSHGDATVGSRIEPHLRTLEGLLAFTKVSVDEAGRLGQLGPLQQAGLRQVMDALRGDVSHLVEGLERLID